MKSKFQKVAELKFISGFDKDIQRSLLTRGEANTGTYSGSGRHTKAISKTDDWRYTLTTLGINYEHGNNAPRGGVGGEYIRITDKAFLKAMKANNKAIEAAKAEAERIASIADAERKARIAEIMKAGGNEGFEKAWYDLNAKIESGKSWNQYRNELKATNPDGWQILKTKFAQTVNA